MRTTTRMHAGGGVNRRNTTGWLDGSLERLTTRESEVLALMAEGRSNPAIARRLDVTGKAIEKHVGNIFTKLDLPPAEEDHRRVLAVLRWMRS